MNNIISVIFFLLFAQVSYGQLSGVIFVGSVTLKGTDEHYPYKIQFTDSNGVIKGYSLTDIGGANETKSAIRGTINKSNKEIIFDELNIVSTKSKSPKEDFCFIHAKLRVSTIKGAKILKGHFTGTGYDHKTTCADGSIMLFSAADVIDKLMGMVAKTDTTKNKVVPTKDDKAPDQVFKISPGSNMEIVSDGTAILDIWDNAKIDGDIVSIEHNGKNILDHYMIKGDMKELTVKMEQTIDTITIIAISEGAEPPNTARVKVTSGNATYYIDASSTISQPVRIILKRK